MRGLRRILHNSEPFTVILQMYQGTAILRKKSSWARQSRQQPYHRVPVAPYGKKYGVGAVLNRGVQFERWGAGSGRKTLSLFLIKDGWVFG